MDLGCIDFGCGSDEKPSKSVDSNSSFSSSSKNSKNKSPKGSPPSGNVLNRVTSQIKKPSHRKSSPVNWLPRTKVESYLKRKIKLLQEAGGMNDTLDETLGHTNPHYCRVLREKMAAKEAARKVMEARKAAMVEASWCRILRAARIPNKEADAILIKAEKEVAEAIETAKAKGVMMYDTPDQPRKHFEIETTATGKGSTTTHTIKASLETAFEVDKQVASAVKAAFVKLAHCSSYNTDEYKDLLRKISENPAAQELSESDNGSEYSEIAEAVPLDDDPKSERRRRKKSSPQKFTRPKLVSMMLQRLKCLKDEELGSLATIVATSGLNAALSEIGSHGKVEAASIERFIHGTVRQKQAEPELPSLDKFFVKKMSRLEKEVQDAKNARNDELKRDGDIKNDKIDDVSDLGTVLLKPHSSKLEKEVEEAKINQNVLDKDGPQLRRTVKQEDSDLPSLDKFLVKHVTKHERAVEEAKRESEKENVDNKRTLSLGTEQNEKDLGNENSLEKMKSQEKDSENWRYTKKDHGKPNENQCESLDKCLVKHVSKLEKEKLEFEVKKRDTIQKPLSRRELRERELLETWGGVGLGGDHKSRNEKVKTITIGQPEDGGKPKSTLSRREAREKELLDTWGGIGLGNSIKPHVSRLQRDKTAWIKAEDEKRAAVQKQND